MDVKLLNTTEASRDALDALFRWADSVDLTYAWAGARQGKAAHWQILDLAKIRRALIGTQFAQTEPWVLETLQAASCELKVMLDSEGTFHPKLAIGRRKDGTVRVLMGSSNLTVGGFETNTELNVLLMADGANAQVAKAVSFFNQCWARGKPLDFDPTWLERYKAAYARRPKPTGIVPMSPWHFESIDSLEMDWDGFVRMIRAQDGRPINPEFHISVAGPYPSYRLEFEGAAKAFAGDHSFASLSLDERKFVIGIQPSSGLLGNMSAAGEAKALIYRHPERIATWLDRIPLHGDVSAILPEVLEGMTSLLGVKVGVASRLLVAKRPDVFVSVNNGSRTQLMRIFGRNITTNRHYLDLLQVVWATEWFRSARPDDPEEGFIWDHRAALLDAALYEAT